MSIGQVIRNNREKLGWTQEELAKKLGISVSTVGMIETDKRNVKDTIKFQLCSLFNISISDLMDNNNKDNIEFLKEKVIAILLQKSVTKSQFNIIMKEVKTKIESEECQFSKYYKNVTKETIRIMQTILSYSTPRGLVHSTNEEQIKYIQKNKEQILNMINSIKYDDLEFENFIDVYSQGFKQTAEASIRKNPYEEKDKYFAIKIQSDKMTPKYERGNIVIIQKSEIFTNGQDVCFKEHISYELGRIYINDDIVIIKYLKSDSEVKTFKIDEFKKNFIGIVFATRYTN